MSNSPAPAKPVKVVATKTDILKDWLEVSQSMKNINEYLKDMVEDHPSRASFADRIAKLNSNKNKLESENPWLVKVIKLLGE
jgi:hypothetical protein